MGLHDLTNLLSLKKWHISRPCSFEVRRLSRVCRHGRGRIHHRAIPICQLTDKLADITRKRHLESADLCLMLPFQKNVWIHNFSTISWLYNQLNKKMLKIYIFSITKLARKMHSESVDLCLMLPL